MLSFYNLSSVCLLAIQKGCEAVDCAGVDCDFAEAEGGFEGSLQEEEVPASRSAS